MNTWIKLGDALRLVFEKKLSTGTLFVHDKETNMK